MGSEIQVVERGRDMAMRIIEELPFIVGEKAITESKKHMALAFGAASPQLCECTEESIGYAIALSAMSGLYPGGPRPDAWLIPRKNRKKDGDPLEANWQISSRGYQRLARRVNYEVRSHVVHRHDFFEYEESEPLLVHRPDVDQEGTWDTIRLGYVKIVSDTGRLDYRILRKDQIQKRRKCAMDDSFWVKWPEEKTLATLYNYAGAREAWPTDAQSRYAMAASDQMETNEIVTLHESDGRQLLASDIAPEPAPEPAADDAPLDDVQLGALKAIGSACGVTRDEVFKRKGWPTSGTLLESDYDRVERAIRVTGVKNGGCKGCGEKCETTHCSPECEAAGELED